MTGSEAVSGVIRSLGWTAGDRVTFTAKNGTLIAKRG